MIELWTARISTRDPDRFDITRSGARRWSQLQGRPEREAPAHPFAPSVGLLMRAKRGELSFGEYDPLYVAEMRVSYREHRAAWDWFLSRHRAVVFCYEADPLECHRSVFARICGKLGADVRGELRA